VLCVRLLKVAFLLALVCCILAALAGAFVALAPYGPRSETLVDIQPGTGTPGIARVLRDRGIIRSRVAFEAMKLWKGGVLKAGVYRFDHPATLAEVYSRLRSGDVYTRTVVIPEGFNIFDIADAMASAGLGSREAFLRAEIQHTELIAAWTPPGGRKPASLEGYLFPDTYKFSPFATPAQMLAVMVRRFGQEAEKLGIPEGPGEGVPKGGISQLQRTVILASLVEKEVRRNGERAEVASVFENRLAAGMPLQTDPSVIYASLLRGTWQGVIHESELHSDSAYNTYTHPGLPPGPICNPGAASLKAALHPAETHFLYFVAGQEGATRFSTTLAEHNANVASYRAAHH
jgi:UPF0755 protein